MGSGDGGGSQRLGRQCPQEQVCRDARTARETGQAERQTYVPHIEPEVLGKPCTDPREVSPLDGTFF